MNGDSSRFLDEWLHRANQDFAQAVTADTDTERELSFVKLAAEARRETLAFSVKGSLALPIIEAYESIDRPSRPVNSQQSVADPKTVHVSRFGAPRDTWDLVHAAQDGDRSAFAKLYNKYVDVVYRYVLYRVGDRELAEDVTSETFLRALRRIESVSYQGRDVGAWFVTIARNLVLDHVKSSRFQIEVATAEVDDTKPAESGPEQQVLSRATRSALLECIRQLGDDQRECIVLRFLQGLSVAETAKVMARNEGAVKALQHRAVRRLAQLLPPEPR